MGERRRGGVRRGEQGGGGVSDLSSELFDWLANTIQYQILKI